MTQHVFVVRSYPPHISPSGGVVHTVVEEMRRAHDVTVVAWAERETSGQIESAHQMKWLAERKRWAAGRAVERARAALALPPLRQRARQLERALGQLALTEDDLVVACTPTEAAALTRMRGPRTRRALLMLEHQLPPSPKVLRTPVLGWAARRWVRRREQRTIASVHRVLALPVVARQLADSGFAQVVEIEHPMLRDLTEPPPQDGSLGVPVLVYAGGLDATNRDPRNVLDVLARCHQVVPVAVDFYSYGNCQRLLTDQAWASFLHSHGAVAPEQAERALRDADVILTIGNADSSHVPSKIFDCVSTGRPIVHFYQHDNDPYRRYLERYPYGLALCVTEDPDMLARQLAEAIVRWRGARLSWHEVRALYPEALPERLIEKLVDLPGKGLVAP